MVSAAAALVAAYGLWRGRGASAAPAGSPLRLSLDLPPGERLAVAANDSSSVLRLSPDGLHMAYVVRSGATTELRLRRLDTAETTVVPGTIGARAPFFSPDGRWLGFTTAGTGTGVLRKVALQGERPSTSRTTRRRAARSGARTG